MDLGVLNAFLWLSDGIQVITKNTILSCNYWFFQFF